MQHVILRSHIILLLLLFLLDSCLNNPKRIVKSFPINADYYFEAITHGNRGYTWLYLCRKDIAERIDIYGARDSTTSSYFMNIDLININKANGDTIWYTIVESSAGNRDCISDSLLLSKRKVLSISTIKSIYQ